MRPHEVHGQGGTSAPGSSAGPTGGEAGAGPGLASGWRDSAPVWLAGGGKTDVSGFSVSLLFLVNSVKLSRLYLCSIFAEN